MKRFSDTAMWFQSLFLTAIILGSMALAAQQPGDVTGNPAPKATPETVAAAKLKELTADRDNQQAWAEMQSLLLQIPQYVKALDKWNGTLAAWRAAVAERQAAEKALEAAKAEAAKKPEAKEPTKQ